MRRLVIVSWLLVGGGALAGEKKIAESEVPKVVLDSVAKKHPSAKQVGFEREVERGKTIYEVRIVEDGHGIDVDVTPDGAIVEEEEEIAAPPPAVKAALAAQTAWAAWTVERVERVTSAGATEPRYELELVRGKRKAELVFSADGKLLRTEK